MDSNSFFHHMQKAPIYSRKDMSIAEEVFKEDIRMHKELACVMLEGDRAKPLPIIFQAPF